MKYLILCSVFIAMSLTACTEKKAGPMERAGSRADEIGDNIAEGKPLLHKKGTMEKAGEAVDEAFDSKR